MGKVSVGASVYVGLEEYPLNKNLEYLKLLKEVGIEHVFISAHIPEMNSNFLDELNIVLNEASNLGLKMIVDVSKKVYDEINLPKIYALRLDYGFSDEDVLKMYKENKFTLEHNASSVTKAKVERLKELGIDLSKIRVSHNFFPKVYTGMDRGFVRKKNIEFKELGINTSIYIPSHNQKRPPMYEGLPTVEAHRFMDLDQVLSEVNYLEADEIIFGDSYCSKEELLFAINFDYQVSIIPVKLNPNLTKAELNQINKIHQNRLDATPYFVRSSVRSNEVIESNNTINRFIGDVTIDNIGMKRYMGEVCIMLKDLGSDDRVNVVGKVVSIDTLELIEPGRKFKFKIVE